MSQRSASVDELHEGPSIVGTPARPPFPPQYTQSMPPGALDDMTTVSATQMPSEIAPSTHVERFDAPPTGGRMTQHSNPQLRAMSEPPSYVMDQDDDHVASGHVATLVRDVEMGDGHGVSDSDAPGRTQTIGGTASAPRPPPLGRWHTDFVIRIRVPGEGKEMMIAHPSPREATELSELAADARSDGRNQLQLASVDEVDEVEPSQPHYEPLDEDIDESQTSNPFLPSPSTSNIHLNASTTVEPPSPVPTEIEFPESQDITVDIQRKGIKIRDFAYAPPYVLVPTATGGSTTAVDSGEVQTAPTTPIEPSSSVSSLGPSASFYHNPPSGSDVNVPKFPASLSSFIPKRTPEIFDQYKAMTEVDFRWAQDVRTFPITGKSLRRLLDMGWVTEQEVLRRASAADLEALKGFDEDRRHGWEKTKEWERACGVSHGEEVEETGDQSQNRERLRLKREMEVYPWRWIKKGKWVKLTGGADDDESDNDFETSEEPVPSSSSTRLLPPLPPLKLKKSPPPLPPMSTSQLADLIGYMQPSTLPPLPPAPRPELRALWLDIKKGYWRQVDRMWIVSQEREMRRRREQEEAGRKVREIEEENQKRKARGNSPGKRRMEEGEEMDIEDDNQDQVDTHGGVKRRKLSPPVDENVPPSSSQYRTPPRTRNIHPSRTPLPHLPADVPLLVPPEKQYPAPVQAYNPKLYPDAKSVIEKNEAMNALTRPWYYQQRQQQSGYDYGYGSQSAVQTSPRTADKGKARATDDGAATSSSSPRPLERTDTPIIDHKAEPAGSSSSQGQTNPQTSSSNQSPSQGQKLVHPKKGLGGLSRQKSFAEL